MKKLVFIFAILLIAFTFSCKKEDNISFSLTEKEVKVEVESSYDFKYTLEGLDNIEIIYELDAKDIIEVNGNRATAVKAGVVNVTLKIKDHEDISDTIKITVVDKPEIKVELAKKEIHLNEEVQIDVDKIGTTDAVTYVSQSPDIVSVSNTGLIKGLKVGTGIIKVSCGDLNQSISIKVSKKVPTRLISLINDKISLEIGARYQVLYDVEDNDTDDRATMVVDNLDVAELDGDVLIAKAPGKCNVTITSVADPNVTLVYPVEVAYATAESIEITNMISSLEIGDTYQLTVKVHPDNSDQRVTFASSNDKYATVTADGTITGVAKGRITINVTSVDNPALVYKMVLSVIQPLAKELSVEEFTEMEVGTEKTLVASVTPADALQSVGVAISDPTVMSAELVENHYVLKALKAGTVTITVTSDSNTNLKKEFSVTVKNPLPTELQIDDNLSLEEGALSELPFTILPVFALQEVTMTSSDETVIKIVDGKLSALKKGTADITVAAKEKPSLTKVVHVTVVEGEDPVIEMKAGTQQDITISQFQTFDPLADVTASDTHSGNLDDKITYTGEFNANKKGVYTLVYEVKDDCGKSATLTRKITVVWNNKTEFIGHAGSFYGLMNSEEAIRYALETLDYQCVEIDLAQTSDGVFVLSHDATFGDYTIASTPWSTFENYTITKTRGGGEPANLGLLGNTTYTTKLCLLKTALRLCKQFGAKLVIEVKSSKGITNSDQSRMQAVMDEIEAEGMLDSVIFLGSQYNCLIWVKQHGYEDIECQYLVNSIESETSLQRCIDYDLSISTNVTYGGSNSDEWLQRYRDNGIKISTWTFSQYNTAADVQVWVDKGVDYVTCDWVPLTMIKHYPKPAESLIKHHVIFKNYDGTVLKEVDVADGKPAKQPATPSRGVGYTFKGWDKDISKVKEDMIVTATYEMTQYSITYMKNDDVLTPTAFANKEAFVSEFYTDLFNWIVANASKIKMCSVNDGVYTFTGDGKTATFSNVEELRALDLYEFERTVGEFIYKPLESRNADGSATIVDDENYFLNSSLYKNKYLGMDQYFYNAVHNNYTSYNDLYKQVSYGRVQIMFRFHQWAKGTNIAVFDNYPPKYTVSSLGIEATMPTTVSYTVEDEITLEAPTTTASFGGWYDNAACTGTPITKIELGSHADIVLYAKWNVD